MDNKDQRTIDSLSEGSRSSSQYSLTSLISLAILIAPLLLLNGCVGSVSGANTTASTLTITNVQAVSTTTSTTQITWTTDVASNSLVNYGATTSYGSSTPVDPTMVTSHQVTLSGLSAGTTYYYEVQSTDSKNNNGKSGGHKFGTLGVSISGTITPTNGGSAATVTLSGTSSATTTANGSGGYAFTGLASGSYVVTPTNSGYSFSPASQNVTLGTTNMTAVNFSAIATTTAPVITAQPANQTVTPGQTATFSVVASGTAPLSYQWQKNGANIAGATSTSYTTPATTTSDSGSTFVAVVSNSAGSATSNAATLTVNSAPVPAIQVNPTSISFGNVVVGTNVSQSLILSNTGTATLSITQITVTGTTFTTSGYTLPITVNAGQQTTISVAFQPTAAAAVSGNISIVSNAPTSPTSVGLGGSGIAATLTLGVSPTSLSFGNVSVGSTTSQSVTVTNTGNSNVTISGVSASGAGFSATGLSANTTLTPSQSATLSVSFVPAATGSVTGSVSVASNATNSPAVVTLSGSGVSSTSTLPTCGKLNDSNVYLPPNYDTFTPPAKGQSYTDPVFGCRIMRITDAAANGWVAAAHFYSLETPFNADDSYLYVFNGYNGGSQTIVDLSGNTVVSSANMPNFNSAVGLVWDLTNPKVFYYTNGQQLIKGTISGTAPNATVASTTLATFSQYSNVVIPDDIDLSSDGLHLWLADCYQNCTGSIFLVTLNAGNGAATSASQSTVLTGITHHGLAIVPNNGVFIDGTLYNSDGSLWNGTGLPDGGTGAHVDFGLNAQNHIVAASLWDQGTTNNGCPSNFGWGLFDLATNALPFCLNDGIQNVGNANHVSTRDTQAKYWIAHSVDDSGSCPSSSYWCYNNSTNMSGWGLYTGEIIIWDGLGNTVRLAHHRSRSDETYWAQSRAAISRDGRYIAFDSNYNQSSKGANYIDVYVIGPLY